MNQIITTGPDRALAAMAMDCDAELPLDTAADIPATIAAFEAALEPLRDIEPGAIVRDPDQPIGFRFDGPATAELANALRPIGIKLNPTMAPEQAGAWLSALIASLSDLPARPVIRGAMEAIHVPIRFFPEVEGVIRDKAQPLIRRYHAAIRRLYRLMQDIEDAARPQAPVLTAPQPALREFTADELAAMARTGNGRQILLLGMAGGWITNEQFEAAMAARGGA